MPTPILPQLTGQGGDEEGEVSTQVSSKQGRQGQQQQGEQQPGSEASEASEGGKGETGDKGNNDEMCIDEWINKMVDRENMVRAYGWWRHVWCMEIRYERVIEYDEEKNHVHKQVAMDKWINMMANKEMKREMCYNYMEKTIEGTCI